MIENPEIEKLIECYPPVVLDRFNEFRSLLFEVAQSTNGVKKITEEIKWGEPSYRSNIGSPVRFGWKEQQPEIFGLYFICTTSLVETFQRVYPGFFRVDGNRGLLFKVEPELEKEPLDNCLRMAITYKKVRNLPDLRA